MRRKSKRGSVGPVLAFIIAAISFIAILFLVGIAIDFINKPEKLAYDGFKCMIGLQAAAKIEEVTMDTINYKPDCKVIPVEIPLSQSYLGIPTSKMTAPQYKEAMKRDFTELIAFIWKISAEGVRSNGLKDMITKIVKTENKCLVIYSVKIKTPNKTNFKPEQFIPLDLADIEDGLRTYTKAEIFNTNLTKEMRISEYLATTGTTAGVLLLKRDADGKYHSGSIVLKDESADAIYGIAVGFDQVSSGSKFFQSLWKDIPQSINDGSSYILIAPYDEIVTYCGVQNE